jgi:hypothetical protein
MSSAVVPPFITWKLLGIQTICALVQFNFENCVLKCPLSVCFATWRTSERSYFQCTMLASKASPINGEPNTNRKYR